ncbi:MAG: TetR/AcrR family transcriptional regulator [Thermoplasmata archaeon]
MCPRKYDSHRRQAAVETTRARILEAARSLIGGKGDLAEFSMELLARRAGVSRMTIYYQFHSRAELFVALADHLAERGGMHRVREAFQEPDPEKALRKLVSTFVEFWASDRVTLRRLRAMGIVFPKEAGPTRDRDAWRRSAVSQLLIAKFGPRVRGARGMPAADLVDVLTSLTSFETFDELCTEMRTPPAVAELLADQAARLVAPAGRAGH